MMRVLSLGAGVQSSTVALMMAKGLIEPAQFAIFADTGAEPSSVYKWLGWLEQQLPFPVHRVAYGDLTEETFRVRVSKRNGKAYGKNFIPSFQVTDGKLSALPRKCTHDFKLVPIVRFIRTMVKPKRKTKEILATQVIGISYDELHRMKSPLRPWLLNEYPLVYRSITRWHCLDWMRVNGYPEPPRSACVYCPYHGDQEWIRLRDEEPEDFAKAVAFERRLWETAQARNVKEREFLHRDCKPLDQVEFKDIGRQADAFGNECEGMCGV